VVFKSVDEIVMKY